MKLVLKVSQFIYDLSLKKIYWLLFKNRDNKYNLPSKEFLLSDDYQKIMNEFIPYDGNFGKYESYTYTRSYIHRHHTYQHLLGVFRWRGMQEYLNEILPLVTDPDKVVVDFGGAGCPLGFSSLLIDRLSEDITGKTVPFHDISELKNPVDVVFASHVFEHVENLTEVLMSIKEKLKENGHLICMVPSFSNKFWNAGQHDHALFGRHVWTMGLSVTNQAITQSIPYYLNIDSIVAGYFQIQIAEYCGDDCILIIATKK